MHGAHVILACRDMRSARNAVNAIKGERPAARVEAMFIDLTSLKTVEQFASNYINRKMFVYLVSCIFQCSFNMKHYSYIIIINEIIVYYNNNLTYNQPSLFRMSCPSVRTCVRK